MVEPLSLSSLHFNPLPFHAADFGLRVRPPVRVPGLHRHPAPGAFHTGRAAALAVGGDAHARHAAHHYGLIGIEIGVTITVAGAMVTLFFEMARPKHFLDVPRHRRGDRKDA